MRMMLEKPPLGTKVRWTDCPDRQSWANKAADKIAELLDGSIAERGVASMLVAGGTTPQPIFKRLSEMHLDWPKVHVGLTDERWVIYLAQELSPAPPVDSFVAQHEEADMSLLWVPLDQAVRAVLDGRIVDAMAASSLLAVRHIMTG